MLLDPFVYQDRVRLLELVLEATWLPWSNQTDNDKAHLKPVSLENFEQCLSSHGGNVLWGVALQYRWQRLSGRLHTYRSYSKGKDISPATSWWSSMNYNLSVLPFLCCRAIFGGDLVSVKLDFSTLQENVPVEIQRLFMHDIDGPFSHPDTQKVAVEAWMSYCDEIKRLQKLPVAEFRAAEAEIRKDLVHREWSAHSRSLQSSYPQMQWQLEHESVPEQLFCSGFAHSVETMVPESYIQTTTATNISRLQQTILPHRLLNDFDGDVSLSPDFTDKQKRFLIAVQQGAPPAVQARQRPSGITMSRL